MREVSRGDKVCLVITTLFGIGYVPLFPGTAACLVAILIFLLIKSPLYFFIFTFIFFVLSFLLSSRAEELFGEKDCKKIVIDDFLGMLVSLLFIPPYFQMVIAGFFTFRLLDFLKVPPADKIEKFKGVRGIVGDDLVAGVYTNIILHCLRLF